VESIWINNIKYNLQNFSNNKEEINNLNAFERKVISFILDWKQGKSRFNFQTSGTTGQLKSLTLSRNQMIVSARMTMEYLAIHEGGTLLLCLEPKYIAGAMMLVRAIICNCDLHAFSPSSNPIDKLSDTTHISMAAFVPMQINEMLSIPDSAYKLKKIEHILIGGAPLTDKTLNKIQSFDCNMYLTFGMTETVSHFAIRKLNGIDRSEYFNVLKGIDISTDDRGCLTVAGPITNNRTIITNDLVEIIEYNKFRWMGRIDHIINSGGIKINIDLLESKIRDIFISVEISNDFYLEGVEDSRLGKKLIMIFEIGKSDKSMLRKIKLLFSQLSKYEKPKDIRIIEKFFLTKTGKIDRIKSLKFSTSGISFLSNV